MDTFPYLGSLITEDGECTTELTGIAYQVKQMAGDQGITAEDME